MPSFDVRSAPERCLRLTIWLLSPKFSLGSSEGQALSYLPLLREENPGTNPETNLGSCQQLQGVKLGSPASPPAGSTLLLPLFWVEVPPPINRVLDPPSDQILWSPSSRRSHVKDRLSHDENGDVIVCHLLSPKQ